MEEHKEIPRENPFKVPERYFEDLAGRIISATAGIEPSSEKKSIFRRLSPYLAVAATVTILAVIGFTAFYVLSSKSNRKGRIELTLNEININYINDIDLLTLEEKIPDSATFDRLPEINSNEIIEYLISENIDITDIYEQL